MTRASLRERPYRQRAGLETGGLTEVRGPGDGIGERRCMDGQAHDNHSTKGTGGEHMQHHHNKRYTHKSVTHNEKRENK